jgi:hypothetical protein
LNFASLCFASKQKLLNRSEPKNLKRKKAKKSEKSDKNAKCFALFCFEAKITQVKRSEKFEAKRSKMKRKKPAAAFLPAETATNITLPRGRKGSPRSAE